MLIYEMWTKGGTCITNVRLEDLPLYREAIRQYGDTSLVVSNIPVGPQHIGTLGSLHSMLPYRDISQFWAIVRSLHEIGWKEPVDLTKAYERAMKGVGP